MYTLCWCSDFSLARRESSPRYTYQPANIPIYFHFSATLTWKHLFLSSFVVFSPCFTAFLCRVEPKSVVSSWIDFIFLLVCLFLIFLPSFFTILPFFLLRYLRLFPSPSFAFPFYSFLARVRVHTRSCIFCCHKCHTLRVTFSILLLLTSFFVFVIAFCCSFFEHYFCTHYHIFLFLRLVHLQTTACFTKNNVSFSIKQRVVFPKTTACFSRFLSVSGSKSE